MATYTSYLNLEKPTTSETFNLLKMNQNWDKIDAGVSALNSNFTPITVAVQKESIVSSGDSSIHARKSGRIVSVIFVNVDLSTAVDSDIKIATISDYRPIDQYFAVLKTINNADVLAFITTNGELKISGVTGAPASTHIYGTLFYITQ